MRLCQISQILIEKTSQITWGICHALGMSILEAEKICDNHHKDDDDNNNNHTCRGGVGGGGQERPNAVGGDGASLPW